MLSRCVLAAAIVLCATLVRAQDAPTREPAVVTAEEESILRAGIDLHDKGQYDDAIAKYQQVLAKSPANVTALFEMAFSYMAKKDYDHALESARKGAEFKSDLLPMFYDDPRKWRWMSPCTTAGCGCGSPAWCRTPSTT